MTEPVPLDIYLGIMGLGLLVTGYALSAFYAYILQIRLAKQLENIERPPAPR